jgi:uncharacterized protein YqfA (UPF0365 family)
MIDNIWLWVIVLAIIIVVITFLSLINISLWFRALLSGAYISFASLMSINVKHLNARFIVNSYIKAKKAGVQISVEQISNHIQAHGDVEKVINALIAAHNASIKLPVATAIAIDLAGRDISEAVKHRITPQVIEVNKITAVPKNGIELSVWAKITLRVNLERIIGGALEETVIARVSEGIVTAIGQAKDHTELMQFPNRITESIMDDPKISAGTAFDILSIDINEIEVGRNIGAEIEIDRAEAVKYISQADAEKRRSEALAAEQEMRALTQEMRARVVAAESEVPKAMAGALRRGNIGVAEYLRLQNIKSDTTMRKAIGGAPEVDMLTYTPTDYAKKKSKIK